MTVDANECPVGGCDNGRKSNQLMCHKHWYMVPRELRYEVQKAAQKMWADLEDEAAFRDWEELRDTAVGEVELQEKEVAKRAS